MSLPLQLGSFQVRDIVVAVADARMWITADGLEGGVTMVATGLKGPAPALLIAWENIKYKFYLTVSHSDILTQLSV